MDYQRAAGSPPQLNRTLGLASVTLLGVGIILGAGIYALIGEGIALAGSNIWISFLAAAVVAALTGLSYAELSGLFPKAGAEFEYISTAFSSRWGFVSGWLVIVAGFISVATVALGFGGYFFALTGFPVSWAAALLTIACTLLVWRGIQESARLATVFTLIECAGLLFIILVGLPLLGSTPITDPLVPWPSVLAAAGLVFFAFIGFEDIVRLSEETKNPTTTIPRAVLLSILISTILYVLVALSAISLVGIDQLSQSSSPLADVAQAAAGSGAFTILSLVALFSTANTVLLFILVVSRLVYGMAIRNTLPVSLATIHPETHSPRNAVLVSGALGLVFLGIGKIEVVANATAFLLFVVFILVNAAVISLRIKKPLLARPFRIPLSIRTIPLLPVLGILSCLFLMAFMPLLVWLLGIVIFVMGIVVAQRVFSHAPKLDRFG